MANIDLMRESAKTQQTQQALNSASAGKAIAETDMSRLNQNLINPQISKMKGETRASNARAVLDEMNSKKQGVVSELWNDAAEQMHNAKQLPVVKEYNDLIKKENKRQINNKRDADTKYELERVRKRIQSGDYKK